MKRTLSVSQAIARGQIMVNAPVSILLFGCPSLAIFLAENDIIPNWGIVLSIILGFGLAWLYWSFMITKWRIWAFSSVRNVHELKAKAIENRLIWKDGSIFEKTEIRSPSDKRKLHALATKFEQEDVFEELENLPFQTKIYYSKRRQYIEFGAMIFVGVIGIFNLCTGERQGYILGTILLVIILWGLRKELKKTRNKTPQIAIDEDGLMTQKTGFIPWERIYHVKVVKADKCYLQYSVEGQAYTELSIDDLGVKRSDLEAMIRTYQARSQRKY